MGSATTKQPDCEYIVVGSGAGGGTLAARLAEAGHSVVLLEAGANPNGMPGTDLMAPSPRRIPADYEVPAFHAFASENDAMKWDFFVRHYADNKTQQRDPKYRAEWNGKPVDGVLYPRAGTLGGCTAHNAMILIYPHNADWEHIANLTRDDSWRPDNMRSYFQLLENCMYRRSFRWLSKLGINPTRHGWKGWLNTELTLPMVAFEDGELIRLITDSVVDTLLEDSDPVESIKWAIESHLDPNDWRLVKDDAVGIRLTPLTTSNHARIGSRERVLRVHGNCPRQLKIELNALATRVIMDEHNRAIGVEYLHGERLYRAHSRPSDEPGELRQVCASREVILAGGAFNTPQLLMLSGIGPREVLNCHNIGIRVELSGVGRNLQDRYEVGVVNRMRDEWKMLKGAKFDQSDPQYKRWANDRDGVYATNGVAVTVSRRTAPRPAPPDLFIMGLVGSFGGYFPTYSRLIAERLNYFTWTVLKAHTHNRAGEVTLKSADPRDPPAINFNYFAEGADEDLKSVIEGIRFARRMSAKLRKSHLIAEEEMPGEGLCTDEQLTDFVRCNAWGHHASCTCPIGPKESNGVLDSNFRVHGTQNLRVVDASVFPRIPGFFIVSAVYMIAEKAADVILADAKRSFS